MGISINTNIAASRAGMYLKSNHANLQKSLDRLSSGRRITEPADDAGGLAVSMKLEHTAKVLQGVSNNISNAISLMQVQDGALKSVADIVSRIGELQGMYNDPTKSTSDKAAYDAEFGDLQSQIQAIEANTKFNDIDVFGEAATATDVTVFLDENLSTSNGNIRLNDVAILGANGGDLAELVGFDSLDDIPVANTDDSGDVSKTLEEVAGHRADNGGQVRRLQYALANAQTQITNLTAANGRIVDVDIAAESANLARQQVLTQASAAMTAQANTSNDVALMLLQ
jgi:flagellin